MFSFRTTPLEDQLDKALVDGKVGCFCTQNCWNPDKGGYMYEIFRGRGNLAEIFSPVDTELMPGTDHIEFDIRKVSELNAVVVEIQDTGSRCFNYTVDLFRLMDEMNALEEAPALYIVDHPNPAGRTVEGTQPSGPLSDGVLRTVHRHGLTLGELAAMHHSEIGARYGLHVISAIAAGTVRQMMPWTIAPAPDIPGFFTCEMYSGGALWNYTDITPGIGTPRPYEYIGAPFVKTGSYEPLPLPSGVLMRPCSFTPAYGRYSGQKCFGYQIILEPGAEYHSLLHTLQLMRYFKDRYSMFEFSEEFHAQLADPVLSDYVEGRCEADEMREHIKVEEQKWIRKVKKYLLYDNQPYRIK